MILASGITATEISVSLTIFIFVTATVGGVVTYFLRRRGSTGTTETSDATVLWAQAQAMREELQEQIDKVTAQRDRLMESQYSQVLPVLTMIIESLRQITQALARLEKRGHAGS